MRIGRAAAAVVNAAYRSWGTLTLIGADRSVFDVDKVAGGGGGAVVWGVGVVAWYGYGGNDCGGGEGVGVG